MLHLIFFRMHVKTTNLCFNFKFGQSKFATLFLFCAIKINNCFVNATLFQFHNYLPHSTCSRPLFMQNLLKATKS